MSTLLDRLFCQPFRSATSQDSTSRFATSWLLSPLQLAIWRGLVCLYAFVVLFTILGVDSSSAAGQTFSYFTVLGYWGLAFYYGFAAAHSASFWLHGRAWLQDWPKGLQCAHSAYHATVTVFPFIVTAVFWGALANAAFISQFSTWANISEHALNSVFAFCEIIIPRTNPHPWINVVALVVLLALYLGLAYLTYSTQGFYVYGFLDPSTGRGVVAGACIGILAATIVLFTIIHWLIRLRIWITETKLGLDGKLSSRQAPTTKSGSPDPVEMAVVPPKADDIA